MKYEINTFFIYIRQSKVKLDQTELSDLRDFGQLDVVSEFLGSSLNKVVAAKWYKPKIWS